MKPYKLMMLSVFLFGIFGCKEVELPFYSGDYYVQFYDYTRDSVDFTFFFYQGEEHLDFPMRVKLIGRMDKDVRFRLKVAEEESTAPDDFYTLSAEQVIEKGLVTKNVYLTIHKQPAMDLQKYRLVIDIVDGGDALAGEATFSRKILWLSNLIARPEWWDSDVVSVFLGNYSDKKYMLLRDITGVTDWTDLDSSSRRMYALLLKYYLRDEKEAGRTVLDEDGNEMTVPVSG